MSTNISKKKRDDLLDKIKQIRAFIAAAPQDENTGNLLSYLSDLEKDVNGKKYGLVFEEHREKIDEVLDAGFDAVQMARALLNEPGFVNRMAREDRARCNCGHSNYCIGRMYTIEMACHKHLNEELPPCLQKEIEKLEKQ